MLLQSELSEGADRVAGQLRGDKEYPFSGVTKSGRVWRKVPESGARSVAWGMPERRLTVGTSPGQAELTVISPYASWSLLERLTGR